MDLPNPTFAQIVFRLIALLGMAGVHGAAIAWAAVLLGDKGPRHEGRTSLWPGHHIDLVGTASVVVFGLGWTRQVEVDAAHLRTGPAGVVMVVLAGFAALLALAFLLNLAVLPVVTSLSHNAAITLAAFLRDASHLAIWLALVSLIPVPPLCGGLVLNAAGVRLPGWTHPLLVMVILLAIASGIVTRVMGPFHAWLVSVLLGG